MGVSENDFGTGWDSSWKARAPEDAREAQQRRRGGEGQRGSRACRAWEGAGEGWNRWKSRRSKIAVSAVWNVNPKDFTNFYRKKNLFFGDLKLSCSPTWHLEFRCNLTCVFACLWGTQPIRNQSKLDKISPILTSKSSQVHPIAINKWNGFWLPEHRLLRDPTSHGSLKCPSPIYWCWWVPLAKASSWRAWVFFGALWKNR